MAQSKDLDDFIAYVEVLIDFLFQMVKEILSFFFLFLNVLTFVSFRACNSSGLFVCFIHCSYQ